MRDKTVMKQDAMREVRRRGQALVELTVMLVAVMVVVGVMVQITRLSREHLQTINRARIAAATCAIDDNLTTIEPPASLIAAWTDGPDQSSYSKDDVATYGADSTLRFGVVNYARPSDLQQYVPTNRLGQLMDVSPLAEQFDLVRGTAHSKPIPVLPVVRHLLYADDTIKIEEDAVLVWLKGIN